MRTKKLSTVQIVLQVVAMSLSAAGVIVMGAISASYVFVVIFHFNSEYL